MNERDSALIELHYQCDNAKELTAMIQQSYWFWDDETIQKNLEMLTVIANDIQKRADHLKAVLKKDGAERVAPDTEENASG